MSSFKDDFILPANCKEVVKSKFESLIMLDEFVVLLDQLYFLANRAAPRESPKLKVINFDHTYSYEGYNSDFGPFDLNIVHKYCTEIDKLLK